MIIVEIDGLAYEVLREAVERGDMPVLKEMIDSKDYTLRMWETDLSSQTGASQAGILHGNNEGIVAFRWIEKGNGNQMMQCSGITKVPELEERISNGDGLLVDNGASRSNLFSGDTDNVIFTFSKIMDFKKLYNKAWYSVSRRYGTRGLVSNHTFPKECHSENKTGNNLHSNKSRHKRLHEGNQHFNTNRRHDDRGC